MNDKRSSPYLGDHVFGDAKRFVSNQGIVISFVFHGLFQIIYLVRSKSPKEIGDNLCLLEAVKCTVDIVVY